jgi:hypothetical protein
MLICVLDPFLSLGTNKRLRLDWCLYAKFFFFLFPRNYELFKEIEKEGNAPARSLDPQLDRRSRGSHRSLNRPNAGDHSGR